MPRARLYCRLRLMRCKQQCVVPARPALPRPCPSPVAGGTTRGQRLIPADVMRACLNRLHSLDMQQLTVIFGFQYLQPDLCHHVISIIRHLSAPTTNTSEEAHMHIL